MQQQTKTIYSVKAGEGVKVEVEAQETGYFVRFYFNSSLVEPTVVNPPTFQFVCRGAVNGRDYGLVSCHFADEAPDDASYRVYLTGDAGGGKYAGPKITKASTIWDCDLTFKTK